MSDALPSVSIVMPTLNAARTLADCLASIRNQDYPRDKVEIVIADAASTDKTVAIAADYKVDKIVENKLVTGEAGKAAALKVAGNEIIALIDSDNILPSSDWLRRMVQPFEDPEIFGSEPLEYTWRREDNYITRYCALIGMNDPLCLFLGNYDRFNTLTGKWTGMPVRSEDAGTYLKIGLDERKLPTIGANGACLRRSTLEAVEIGDYLFDIDVIYHVVKRGKTSFAKVKIGIVHLFGGNMATFARKQNRRIADYRYYQKQELRSYPWKTVNRAGLAKFIIYCLLVLPLLGQATIGFIKKPDVAWFFHPVACWITLCIYGWGQTFGRIRTKAGSRNNWSQ